MTISVRPQEQDVLDGAEPCAASRRLAEPAGRRRSPRAGRAAARSGHPERKRRLPGERAGVIADEDPGDQHAVGHGQEQRRRGEPVPPQGVASRPRGSRRGPLRQPRRSRPGARRWPSPPAGRPGPRPSWAPARSRRRRAAHRRSWTADMGRSLAIASRVGSGPAAVRSRSSAGRGCAFRIEIEVRSGIDRGSATGFLLDFLGSERVP